MAEKYIKPGFVFHIKDSYFDFAKDDKLMRNHEGGAHRPTYFCLENEKNGLLWVVPMSSQVEKYRKYVERDIEKFGKCSKIYLGEYAGKNSVFLLQNMFPILPKYISHVHTIDNVPYPLDDVHKANVRRCFMEVTRLHKRGANIVFPDIDRLEKLMLNELAQSQPQKLKPIPNSTAEKPSLLGKVADNKKKIDEEYQQCQHGTTKRKDDLNL